MGLGVEVGIIADLVENGDESFEYYEDQFAAINEVLDELGLPQHTEPSRVDDIVSFDMWSYSGLHYLRRFAAHIDENGKPPTPGDENAAVDPILQKYYAEDGSAPECRFAHLMDHSDTEGYYIPVDFPAPIHVPEDSEITGGIVGSSHRLLAECEELAKHLGLPADIDPESDAIWDAAENQGSGDGWEKYGVESFTCLRLMHAARASIKNRSAIVFV